jgi:hypothetical protein
MRTKCANLVAKSRPDIATRGAELLLPFIRGPNGYVCECFAPITRCYVAYATTGEIEIGMSLPID